MRIQSIAVLLAIALAVYDLELCVYALLATVALLTVLAYFSPPNLYPSSPYRRLGEALRKDRR